MTEANRMSSADQTLLQLVYDMMSQRGAWPTFTAVDIRADRELGIEDAQASLAALPSGYLARSWHAYGFSDSDEVRLTLRGIAACRDGSEDLALLDQFITWLVKIESEETTTNEEPLVAKGEDFAAYLGLPFDEISPNSDVNAGNHRAPRGDPSTLPQEVAAARETMSRIRVLADLLPHFWQGVGWPQEQPWRWQYSVDRRRLRPYRRVRGADALLSYTESQEHERAAAAAAWPVDQPESASPQTVETQTAAASVLTTMGGDLGVLLTMLREEIIHASADLVRAGRFDDAIFAAFRRVEHELQQRVSNLAIGNTLINLAFRERKDPIRVTERAQDQERLVELFGGAIGLFKGDRSHKDQPLLPCRSRHECLRILAHASTLLDLLDRDIDRAPSVRGYEHRQGNTLTLRVERAGSQVEVWLDALSRLKVLSFQPGTLVVDVTGVSPGEHRIHLAEGYRQGSACTVWLTSNPGMSSWCRVMEVDIPLYGDEQGLRLLDVTGIKLAYLVSGILRHEIHPTRDAYQVGHYVSSHYSFTETTGNVWMRTHVGGPLNNVWLDSAIFDGQPVAPAHPQRLMRISLEPGRLLLRVGEKSPLRALAHFTDGTAMWSEPLDDPKIEPDDETIIAFRGGTVIAKASGITVLRCLHDGCSAEAAVEVAAHPRGAVTELLTGLPPVTGVACTAQGTVVSTRGGDIWRVETNGVFRKIAAIPQALLEEAETVGIAARDDGELAVFLSTDDRILVMHRGESGKGTDDYHSSHFIKPEFAGTLTSATWHDGDLIVTTSDGVIHRVSMNGKATPLASVGGYPFDVACTDQGFLVLSSISPEFIVEQGETGCSLWSIPFGEEAGVDLLADQHVPGLIGVAHAGDDIYMSDFQNGRILRLPDGRAGIPEIAVSGLTDPGRMSVDTRGAVYVAEFEAGKVHRIFP
ncbi:TIGR02391 family protein [Streptomyces sp. NPDC087219]|uniref:TIGR02391 family protein n=1 Tax=Streptomyces sp. NPDC087219 TaxID=3365770 RepID=UPI00382175B5